MGTSPNADGGWAKVGIYSRNISVASHPFDYPLVPGEDVTHTWSGTLLSYKRTKNGQGRGTESFWQFEMDFRNPYTGFVGEGSIGSGSIWLPRK